MNGFKVLIFVFSLAVTPTIIYSQATFCNGTVSAVGDNIVLSGNIQFPDASTFTSASAIADFNEGGDIAGAAREIGNDDNFNFSLITNNLHRIHITNDGKVAIGLNVNSSNAPLEVVGVGGVSVGGFPAGTMHVRGSGTVVNSNAVITGHSSFNTNTQLWYLGSTSSSNNNIAFINRQTAELHFHTSDAKQVTIEDDGDVVLEKQIRIKGGSPGLDKVLTSDAVGIATWVSPLQRAEGGLYKSTTVSVGTSTISLPFDSVSATLVGVTKIDSTQFRLDIDSPVSFTLEPQFNRSTGGTEETVVVWYETSTDNGVTWVKGETIFVEMKGGDSVVSPLSLIYKGNGNRVRFRAQGTTTTSLEFIAIAAGTLTSDHSIIPAYILTIG